MLYSLQVIRVIKGIFLSMWLQFFIHYKKLFSLTRSRKLGAILSLFALSFLVVACGTNTTSAANLGSPAVTVTIDMNGGKASPTPSVPAYWCGAWATQSSPPIGTAAVGVYGKFVHNVKSDPNDPNDPGNPQGIEGASAIATVVWPNGTEAQIAGITGVDGLAAFSVPTAGRMDALNKITFVTVQFTKDGIPPCTVDQARAAFFTLLPGNAVTKPITGPITGGTPGVGPTITGGPNPKPTKPPKH